MYYVQEIASGIFWVGGTDKRLERFENMFPLPQGVAYNSHLILDEKTALMDTVDAAISAQFLENIEHVLNGRSLDYLVVGHMEPDHCANIEELLRRYPDLKIVGNKRRSSSWSNFTRSANRTITSSSKRGRASARQTHSPLLHGSFRSLAGGHVLV